MSVYRTWAQGMRRQQANAASDWREVLYSRLTLDYSRIRQGYTTEKAEIGLGLAPCAYYFVSRCEPEFGDSAILFSAENLDTGTTTPFDSGGFWFEHIKTARPLHSADDRRKFFQQTNVAVKEREFDFERWLKTNFSESRSYVEGCHPSQGCFNQQIVTTADTRTWIWECRVERRLLPSSRLQPIFLVLPRRRYDHYRGWVIDNDKLGTAAKHAHIAWLQTAYVDPGERNPGEFLNELIERDCT